MAPRRSRLALLTFMVLVLASVLSLYLWGAHRTGPAASFLSDFTSSPRSWFAQTGDGIQGRFSALLTRWNAPTQIEALETENRQLRSELQDLRLMMEQYAHLQESETLQADLEIDQVLAYVIGQADPVIRRAVVIDKGSRHGIDTDFPVLSGGILIGRITRVLSGSSRVLLLNDPSSVAGVKIVPRGTGIQESVRVEGLRGKLSGATDGTGLVLELERDAPVHVGDEVLTSRLSTIYPEGLLIGEVGELKERGALLKSFWVKPYADYNATLRVQILRYSDNQESLALLRETGS